jgi:hypothetical protein
LSQNRKPGFSEAVDRSGFIRLVALPLDSGPLRWCHPRWHMVHRMDEGERFAQLLHNVVG